MKRIILSIIILFSLTSLVFAEGSFVAEPGQSVTSAITKVVTAQTAVQLSSTSTRVLSIVVYPLNTNKGKEVWVGDSGVVPNSDGIPLASTSVIELKVNDLSDVYVNSNSAGDGVGYIAIVR